MLKDISPSLVERVHMLKVTPPKLVDHTPTLKDFTQLLVESTHMLKVKPH